jgi:hypothetical protein
MGEVGSDGRMMLPMVGLQGTVNLSQAGPHFNVQSAGPDARLLPHSVSKSAKLTVPSELSLAGVDLLGSIGPSRHRSLA